MKKRFKDTFAGRFITGAVGAYFKPLGGLIAGGMSVVRDNKLSPHGGTGKIDKAEMTGTLTAVAILILVIALVAGWIDLDTFTAASEQVK